MGFEEMHPLQPSYELKNQIPRTVPCHPDQFLYDLPIMTTTTHNLPLISNTNTDSITGHDMGKQHHLHQLKSSSEIQENNGDDQGQGSTKRKRIIHRDIERQRRLEMASLYASLRSLLPLEYIKGKQAISDNMHETVNYIKYLQTKISQLGARRDSLTKMSRLRSFNSGNSGNAHTCLPNCTNILVSPCRDGVELLICSSPKEEVFPLSKVLNTLLAEGLNVVSRVSTTVNETKVHKIQSEIAYEQASINILALQQILSSFSMFHLRTDR